MENPSNHVVTWGPGEEERQATVLGLLPCSVLFPGLCPVLPRGTSEALLTAEDGQRPLFGVSFVVLGFF